ncbi:hypothetical protein MJT46_002152 [Ovis ammon polii x Ovis aries]|nr:hypothetical protein MJT46_002152 [Ovis ammon polii x Ovis aries]
MRNQKENYSEPSLVKDTRRQHMRDSPSAREKLIVVILGIICFVLMYTIVRVVNFIPRTQISEQNKSSLVTKLHEDSPSAREKLIVVILGIICFVLMYTIVRVITFIPRKSSFERL